MGKCKDCKWWEVAASVVNGIEMRHCQWDSVMPCEHRDNWMSVHGDEDGGLATTGIFQIATGPEFGCIHFEQDSF